MNRLGFIAAGVAGVLAVVLVTSHPRGRNTAAAAQRGDRCTAWLATFDTLDYDVFSNQKWDGLSESHASDVVVTWPDGHETNGIPRHIEDLKAMIVYAPDTKIKEHPDRDDVVAGERLARHVDAPGEPALRQGTRAVTRRTALVAGGVGTRGGA